MPPLLTTPRAALSGGTRQNSAVITPASAPRGDDSASRRSSGDDSHVDGPLRKTPRACKLTGVLYLPRVLLPGTELAEKMLDWLPEPRRGQLQQQLRDAKEKEGSVGLQKSDQFTLSGAEALLILERALGVVVTPARSSPSSSSDDLLYGAPVRIDSAEPNIRKRVRSVIGNFTNYKTTRAGYNERDVHVHLTAALIEARAKTTARGRLRKHETLRHLGSWIKKLFKGELAGRLAHDTIVEMNRFIGKPRRS